VATLVPRLDSLLSEIQGKITFLCAAEVPTLQEEFRSLTEEIEIDRQVVRNFGFEKTVEEIKHWGSLPTRQIEDAAKTFRKMVFDATIVSVIQVLGAVGSLTPGEVDALNRLADAQGAPPLGIVGRAQDVEAAVKFLKKTKSAYEGLDAGRQGRMLDAAVKLGSLALKNPAYGLLITADKWALYQFYQSASAVVMVQRMTQATEGDLKLLKSRSDKLRNQVNQLKDVRIRLTKLSALCDSTRLVEKPPLH